MDRGSVESGYKRIPFGLSDAAGSVEEARSSAISFGLSLSKACSSAAREP